MVADDVFAANETGRTMYLYVRVMVAAKWFQNEMIWCDAE